MNSTWIREDLTDQDCQRQQGNIENKKHPGETVGWSGGSLAVHELSEGSEGGIKQIPDTTDAVEESKWSDLSDSVRGYKHT